MKTKNSMAWFNLYSTELRYRVEVKPSYFPFYCVIYLLILVACILTVHFTYAYLAVSFFVGVTVFLSGFIFYSKFSTQYKVYNYIVKHNVQEPYEIELSDKGECDFFGDKWLIHPNSRVSFFGCWLFLSEVGSQCISKKMFIYRQSLSHKDFARLCRMVDMR